MRRGPGITTVASLLAVTLGGCTEADPKPHDAARRVYDAGGTGVYKNPEAMVVSDAKERELRDMYAEIVKWSGGKVTARLVIVEGRDEFVCQEAGATLLMVTSLGSPMYCPQTNAIVMTGEWISSTAPGIDPHNKQIEVVANMWLLGHEAGHSREAPMLAQLDTVNRPTKEQRADCFAGTFIGDMVRGGKYGRDVINSVVTVLKNIPEDAEHGTTEQRISAYMRGVNDEDCGLVKS